MVLLLISKKALLFVLHLLKTNKSKPRRFRLRIYIPFKKCSFFNLVYYKAVNELYFWVKLPIKCESKYFICLSFNAKQWLVLFVRSVNYLETTAHICSISHYIVLLHRALVILITHASGQYHQFPHCVTGFSS